MGIEIIAGLFGLFVFMFLKLLTTAPDGYQDKSGFHLGTAPVDDDHR
mgnify:CR=1 FL=1